MDQAASQLHLLAPNHGRVFKSFLHAYLLDWREREQRLRVSGAHLRND